MADSMALFQNAYYIGNNFNAILYGIGLVLYYQIVRIMLNPKHKQARSDKFFLFFSTALLCLNTVFVATEAVFGEEMWIVNANYPGGQDAYLDDFASVWYQTLGTADQHSSSSSGAEAEGPDQPFPIPTRLRTAPQWFAPSASSTLAGHPVEPLVAHPSYAP
ncbi:hypothetical protein NUW54_g13280 [Trametes sanguinea]|uniref:Uncharacterized protein n=1 Tax=Trametes sanguinea TaxID=158606 RepID=A0ACC1MPN7_9APHY|nr:hypothetical protein NUW54_g13280 [Trametes sanguinea]